jgi:hypothetical protein
VLIVFAALAHGEPLLGLPALGGLFASDVIPLLESARLPNRFLMEAIFRLGWLHDEGGMVPVNWRDMETEELGSVYESLLELTPRLADDGRSLVFAEGAEAKGHARKTTGSYYTPDSLVQALLDSALDPVLDRAEAQAEDPAAALLGLSVIDPACGSGHFLLAAGRRIATRVAQARTHGAASIEDYRHALRDVARRCLFGVDRNPMAVELTKVALWIETVDPGRPLGFLDGNIRCGDSLLGVYNLETLTNGIPDAAYKPLTGDDKAIAKAYASRNKAERAGERDLFRVDAAANTSAPFAREHSTLRALPEDSAEEVAEKRRRFEAARAERSSRKWGDAADLFVAAFFLPKTGDAPRPGGDSLVPTSEDVRSALAGEPVDAKLLARAIEASRAARALHWPLEFPDVFAAGGFDVVLGNPPWERVKLQEQEFFAASDPEIAAAPNTAARGKMIAALVRAAPGTRDRTLHEAFEMAKHFAEASSVFVRESARFPLTGRGDVNTYALFGELFSLLVSAHGRAGMIVPTGIATDATTAAFFGAMIDGKRLARFWDFENRLRLFAEVDSRMKFALLTVGGNVDEAEFAFFLTDVSDAAQAERRFTLSPEQIARINPNTKTSPIFRSESDARLTARIYDRVPVLIDESKGASGNPWGISFMRMFDMSNDSGLFRTAEQLVAAGAHRKGTFWTDQVGERWLPLYEAKMVHQYDHRWATYEGLDIVDVTDEQKRNPFFDILGRYWIPESEVEAQLQRRHWSRDWLIGWRDITNATNERTIISTIFPKVGVGHKLPLMIFDENIAVDKIVAFVANLSSLACDFVARNKVGGTNLSFFIFKQLPVLLPQNYSASEISFIASHVLRLSFTNTSLAPFAADFGYHGPPFAWDEDRRGILRAELDAFYARKYGLTRDELRYILDPADAMGPSYPSETFRVLKKNEIRHFGEYRTARLVLEAWDRMERGEFPELSAPT